MPSRLRGVCNFRTRIWGCALRPHNIDIALEERAVFNGNTSRGYVAGNGAGLLNLNYFGGFDIAIDGSYDHDLLRVEVGNHFCVRADGNSRVNGFHFAFYFSV